jgi:DNA-binding NtrC family response regulator
MAKQQRECGFALTDLVMPNQMNGRELAEKLWAEQPHLKVILPAAIAWDVAAPISYCNEESNYLQKPYPPKKACALCARLLDSYQLTFDATPCSSRESQWLGTLSPGLGTGN